MVSSERDPQARPAGSPQRPQRRPGPRGLVGDLEGEGAETDPRATVGSLGQRRRSQQRRSQRLSGGHRGALSVTSGGEATAPREAPADRVSLARRPARGHISRGPPRAALRGGRCLTDQNTDAQGKAAHRPGSCCRSAAEQTPRPGSPAPDGPGTHTSRPRQAPGEALPRSLRRVRGRGTPGPEFWPPALWGRGFHVLGPAHSSPGGPQTRPGLDVTGVRAAGPQGGRDSWGTRQPPSRGPRSQGPSRVVAAAVRAKRVGSEGSSPPASQPLSEG